jgi:hypothetical protein
MLFNAVESRVNAAVLQRLANATATIVQPADAAGCTIDGVFVLPYLAVDVGPGVETAAPEFSVAEADVPSAVVAALTCGEAVSLTLNDATYRVVEAMPDGTGLTTLRLRK